MYKIRFVYCAASCVGAKRVVLCKRLRGSRTYYICCVYWMLDTPIGVWQKICIPDETFLFLKRYICSVRAGDSADAAA